jgi:signal transduction histidine kinase
MAGRSLRTLLFLLAVVPVGAVALAGLIAGWVVVICLAITPLVVYALVGLRMAVGGVARVDAELANELLGTSVRPPIGSTGPPGFFRRATNVLADLAFWRQQAYLAIRLSLGFGIALAEWTLLATSLGFVSLPIWFRWGHANIGHWQIDTLGDALLAVPIGLAGLAIALALLGPIASFSRFLVRGLLEGGDDVSVEPLTLQRRRRRRALAIHASVYAVFNGALILNWALLGGGYFWPEWTLIVFGVPLAIHAWVELVEEQRWRAHGLAIHAGVSAVLALFFTLVWAVTGGGYFWPVWPILLLAVAVAIDAIVTLPRRGAEERIAVLEETRAGAVDLQESELRRIERDLHDGAQARLVALGMSLGMAEQKLASDPAAALALLAEARQGTHEALEELRSLARGIHPPVLADRGLEAAISALADRTPIRVDVAVDVPRRPPAAVETAAYFVVAEALANSGKHAGAGHVEVDVHDDDGNLVVRVVDDGSGGADPNGSGLRGLARRVEALDGRLAVTSPAGGPTTVEAVIPCGS